MHKGAVMESEGGEGYREGYSVLQIQDRMARLSSGQRQEERDDISRLGNLSGNLSHSIIFQTLAKARCILGGLA
jgi:hypothetical protein